MALFRRIWAAVTLVNLAVLTLFVGLATLRFDAINSGLAAERLAVLAGRTAAPFESAARLGLPLSGVRNAAALLERARQTDPEIAAIHVFDAAGLIVHSTDTVPPAEIPSEAAAARAAAAGAPWHSETGHALLSSIDIAKRNGTSAGGILIVYPDTSNVTRVRAMAAELAISSLGVLALAALAGGLLLRLGLARQLREFEEVDAGIADFERSAWRSAAGRDLGEQAGPDDLRQLLDAAETRYRAAGHAISANSGDRA